MGSTVAVSARSYAEVRGFPKRMAGEDFYFLNKLAKVGSIVPLPGDPIELDGRASDRVPFGTGKAMTELLAPGFDLAEYRFPSPMAFDILRRWIEQLEEWIHEAVVESKFQGKDLSSTKRELHADVASWSPAIHEDLLSWLGTFGVFAGLAPLLRLPANDARTTRAVHGWFDGFRTLMFLHGLRDLGFSDLPHTAAIDQADFIGSGKLPGRTSGPRETLAVLTALESERCREPLSRAAGGRPHESDRATEKN